MGPTKMTPEDQQFNISFVAEVKKHTCLFDSNSTEYKQSQVQDRAWQAVSANVNESVDMCKKRWRNLRCCMTRYLKSVRDNSDSGSNVKRKPYYLFHHMQFVIPHLKMKDADTSNYESEDPIWVKNASAEELHKADEEEEDPEIETIDLHEEEHQDIKQSMIQSIKILPIGQDAQNQDTTTTTYEIIEASPSKQGRIETVHQVAVATPVTNSPQLLKHKEPTVKHYTYATVGTAQPSSATLYTPTPIHTGQHRLQVTPSSSNSQRQPTLSSSVAADADNNFFKSLIPDIESMSMEQKRKLKIGILRLIDEILSTT